MAARQHGVVIARATGGPRLRGGRDQAPPPRRASPPPSPGGLRRGPDAALSHQSAGTLWRILPRWQPPIHVTAARDRRRPGIHVHRSPHADTTTHYGIRVATPARTLVDLADVLTPINEPEPSTKLRSNGSSPPPSWPPSSPASQAAAPHNSRPSGAPPARPSRTPSPASSNATTSRSRSATNRSPATKSTPSTEPNTSSSNLTATSSTPPQSIRARPRARRRPPQRGVFSTPHHPTNASNSTPPTKHGASKTSSAAAALSPPPATRGW